MGYTPNLTVGVWVGNSNNDEMLKVTGAIGAAVIWNKMMETFYDTPEFVDLVRTPDGQLNRDFVQPDGLIRASACSAKGGVTDLFLKEAPPGRKCVTYQDPKTNKALRAAPSNNNNNRNNNNNNNNNNNRPRTNPNERPTPIPGIIMATPEPRP
jgi:membrane peptidoglycan carboxypeptidase